jgi:hypothetical protein
MFLTGQEKRQFSEILSRISDIENKISTFRHKPEGSSIQNVEDEKPLSDYDKRKAAYALNLCTVSISQIIDYDDIYILEQEYDAILNNLHIQNFIKDEALLDILKQLLDVITFFKIQEEDKKFIEKEFQHKMKNAIWSAMPNISIIFGGRDPATKVLTIVSQIGVGYMHYRKNKSDYKLSKDKEEWKLRRSAMEQFNGLRRAMFEAAWRLSDTYNFDDIYRLTEKQISRYNAILLDNDPLRRYEKLDAISGTFHAFPPYWYYKGNTAREISLSSDYKNTDIGEGFKCKALDAYREFDELYINFMREDVIAASCALEHISLLDLDTDRDEIRKLLNKAVALAGENFDILQMCVINYIAIGEINPAKAALKQLINEEYNVGLNGLILSRIYCKFEHNKIDYDILGKRIGKNNIMPWIEDDDKADVEYVEQRKRNIVWRIELFLDKITHKYNMKIKNDLLVVLYSKPVEKIDWFNSVDIIGILINALNSYFREIDQLNLFTAHDEGKEKKYREFFNKYSRKIGVSIDALNTKIEFTKQTIVDGKTEIPAINVIKLNAYNRSASSKINDIVSNIDFQKLTKEFVEDIKNMYCENHTAESVESFDFIVNSLDVWYKNNNVPIPIDPNAKEVQADTSDNQDREYFVYDEIINGKKGEE